MYQTEKHTQEAKGSGPSRGKSTIMAYCTVLTKKQELKWTVERL